MGQKITVKLAYNGSQYTDNFVIVLVQNPYSTTCPRGAISIRSDVAAARQQHECHWRVSGRRAAVG